MRAWEKSVATQTRKYDELKSKTQNKGKLRKILYKIFSLHMKIDLTHWKMQIWLLIDTLSIAIVGSAI